MTFSLEILAQGPKLQASFQHLDLALSRDGPQTCSITEEDVAELIPALLLSGELLGSKRCFPIPSA